MRQYLKQSSQEINRSAIGRKAVDPDADWREQLAASAVKPADLSGRWPVDSEALAQVVERHPMRITPYYLGLISTPDDPLGRQAIPLPEELSTAGGSADPTGEAAQSPVPGLIHRHPNRVLLLASNRCSVYCRFCFRKHRVGPGAAPMPDLREALDYIRETTGIEEVILSGGDPLMASDQRLADLLGRLRGMAHVKVLRIHSRMPCTLPQRVTPGLTALLARFQPLYLVTHFNHPAELTPVAASACGRLADAGVPLANQTVLLKGVNDDAATLTGLMQGLLRMRVRPYYLHHPDPVHGTTHFGLPAARGMALMERLRSSVSGLCLPHYVIDLPGGLGKVPATPDAERLASASSGCTMPEG